MKVLAIDDNVSVLKLLVDSISTACPLAQVFPFSKPSELLTFAKSEHCDSAFLDIQIWDKNGLEIAKELKELNPKINIIFVTAYCENTADAFAFHPSGFVIKPVTKEAIEREIMHL